MSPMPSPLMMARRDEYDDDIDDLPPLTARVSRGSIHRGSISQRSPSPKKKKKSVSLFDEQAEQDARDIAAELSRSQPKYQVLIDILPTLSHDQLLELRVAYKRVCKIQGRGINIAKHIKLKTSGNLCKIAYVTALGRWESEGYWANFWYQSNSARRELLIEALMGRTNTEIRNIKDAFKDKRYNDDLSRCMDKELKADKFRAAVLMALEEKRQEENDQWPVEYRNRDVDTLYNALRRRDGGETAILEIVVMRSDAHLRDCLKTYERKYSGNFAKEALRKSNNLVVRLYSPSERFLGANIYTGRDRSPHPQRGDKPSSTRRNATSPCRPRSRSSINRDQRSITPLLKERRRQNRGQKGPVRVVDQSTCQASLGQTAFHSRQG
jgi:hypothetical protein